jgi:hypothetical protein
LLQVIDSACRLNAGIAVMKTVTATTNTPLRMENHRFITANQSNEKYHRPGADDIRFETETSSPGSVHTLGAPDMGVNWKGGSPFVCEHRHRAVLHGQQDDANTRARQLPDREVWWEGSPAQT